MQEQDVQTYRLPGVLLGSAKLVCNRTESILTLFDDTEITLQHRVLRQEMELLITLLAAHPDVCSYAALYAALAHCTREDAHDFLQSLDVGWVEMAIKPVQRVLRACHRTLEQFGLGIQPVEQIGYRIFRL